MIVRASVLSALPPRWLATYRYSLRGFGRAKVAEWYGESLTPQFRQTTGIDDPDWLFSRHWHAAPLERWPEFPARSVAAIRPRRFTRWSQPRLRSSSAKPHAVTSSRAWDGFVPPLLQGVALDGSIPVNSADAMRMAQRLAREFGLLVGTSSGANVAATLILVQRLGPDRAIVTLLPDRAEQYFSTQLFGEGAAPRSAVA